jgi:hypothetical protein
MRLRTIIHCGSFFVVATVLACEGGSAATGTAGDAGPSCEDLQQSARDEVIKAFVGHAQCTDTADCVSTSLAAKCFDSCSRSVNKNFTSDVSAAKDRVNAAQCKQFEAQGCKLIIPPCPPPDPATCISNICQD